MALMNGRGRPKRTQMWVTNPTSEVGLAVRVTALPIGGARRALILVPGSLASGDLYFGVSGIAERLARRGYVVVDFDPDGRGASGGSEDYNGFVHQDGLAAVIVAAAELSEVDAHRVTLVSFCYGATMAVGALARHPALPVHLFVDWEGPALREHVRRASSHQDWPISCQLMDEDWWRDREAAALVRQISVPYQRVQSSPDHVQEDPTHALAMVRNATSRVYRGDGASPWTRINGNPPNQSYSLELQPSWLPRLPAEIAVLPYLLELAPPV